LTFDSFATALLANIVPARAWVDLEYDERIRAAVDAIEKVQDAKDILSETRHVLVDEIQDLVGIRRQLVAAVLEASSGGFTLLGDPAQAIYDWREDGTGGEPEMPIIAWLQARFDFDILEFQENFRALTPATRRVLRLGPLLSGVRAVDADTSSHVDRLIAELPHIGSIEQAVVALKNPMRSTAILCRTNGQALAVSSRLHDLNIPHRMQRRASDRAIAPWVGTLFGSFLSSSMPRRVFDRRFSAVSLEIEAPSSEEAWKLLKRIDRTPTNSIDTARLADGIRSGRVPDQLHWDPPSSVVVSTVHRAKGLEFDTVLLAKPTDLPEDPIEKLGELRVIYVGLTRARTDLAVLTLPVHRYMRLPEAGRWVAIGWQKWQRLGVEVLGEDVERQQPGAGHLAPSDSASALQNYLIHSVHPGSRVVLTLQKASKVGLPRALYAINHNGRLVGSTSEAFGKTLHTVLHSRKNRPIPWPNVISGLHVESIDTVAGSPAAGSSVGFGTSGIWLRVRIGGMGEFQWNKEVG
jgi:hypothetical protein